MSEIYKDGIIYVFSEQALNNLSRDCIAFNLCVYDDAILNMYCTDYITLE